MKNSKEEIKMEEIKITTWELPEYVNSEKNIPIKEITLITKPIEYALYERHPQLNDYNKIKWMVASEIASFVLDSMEYEVIEEYEGRYIHKFQAKCLTEKEKSKYITEISDLKIEIEDFKIKLETKEHTIKRLQSARYRIKNYNFWDRVKFLFKKKGELL